MWTRRLTPDADSPARATLVRSVTAGAARLFGLVLTLLFTTTAVTLALDIGALQCAGDAAVQGPWQWRLETWCTAVVPAQFASPGRLLAVAALVWALLC